MQQVVDSAYVTDHAAEALESTEVIGLPTLGALAGTAWTTARHTGGIAQRVARLATEAGRIGIGRSTIEPNPKDWRFRDPTWKEHPGYHRLMQLYLAAADEVERIAAEADLDWRDTERAKFLASLLTSALAPTNTLIGNPPAVKRMLETGGVSLVRGARHFVHDARFNGGLPAQVDRSAFEVGTTLAATPGSVVYRDEVCEVLQYQPVTTSVRARPCLLIPPQIGRFYFMDLAPGRSFVEHAVSRGVQVFMISWRDPGPAQRDWDLDTYAAAVLRAIDVARDVSASDDVNVLSFCAGGILTATVLSHLAATGDERVRTASFGVTLLDFDSPAMIGAFDSGAVLSLARARSNRDGLITGRNLGLVFALLRPNELVWNYFVNNYLLGNDPPAFDILAWNADHTNLPATLHHQFLEIFANNGVAVAGTVEVLGTPVDLAGITIETYVTGALTDHLTPWRGCYRTTQLMSGDSTFILSNAGHIASLVNPPGNPKAHYFAGPEPQGDADAWLEKATRHQGTWWEHWTDWVIQRAGQEHPPPTRLGSRRHQPLEAAPGLYVRNVVPAA
jgi:polyhydroxyalkanoate synthase